MDWRFGGAVVLGLSAVVAAFLLGGVYEIRTLGAGYNAVVNRFTGQMTVCRMDECGDVLQQTRSAERLNIPPIDMIPTPAP